MSAPIFRSPTRGRCCRGFREHQHVCRSHNAFRIIHPIEIYTHNAFRIIYPQIPIYTHNAIGFVSNLDGSDSSRHLRYQVQYSSILGKGLVLFFLITYHHSLLSIHFSCKFIRTVLFIIRLGLVLFFITYHHPLLSIHSSCKFIPSLKNVFTRVTVVCCYVTSVTSLITGTDISRSRINISLAAILGHGFIYSVRTEVTTVRISKLIRGSGNGND